MADEFTGVDRDAIYRVIQARRDIRNFSPEPVPAGVLRRILEAAHFAPSVGFMQPWNFILIASAEFRRQIKKSFLETNSGEMEKIPDEKRKDLYRSLKLEGIVESPLNIAVTCDSRRGGPFVLGRAPMPETDVFSTCLAIENMWLAARAEGVGVGWVSILDRGGVEKMLLLPDGVRLVAYLCVGYPVEFRQAPMLEEKGWRSRLNLDGMVFQDSWGNSSALFKSMPDEMPATP